MKKLLFAIIAVSFFKCETIQLKNNETELTNVIVKSGQSFGMCVGPCHQEMVIEGKKITLLVKTREFRGSEVNTIETKYEDTLSESELDKIKSYFNKDKSKILASEETIGCPDCADGGAEWIEIIENGKSTKVTFEYGRFPEEFDLLTEFLSKKRTELSEKFVK